MKDSESVSLLELNGTYFIEDDKVSFISKGKFIDYTLNSLYKLIDPVFDQTFKTLFTIGHKSNNICGDQRLISFLNSIISFKYGEEINAIEYLPNELVKANEKRKLGMRIDDLVLKAIFESGRIIFIDIEIQTAFYQKLFKSWAEYASRLFSNVQHETLVLVLQINDKENYCYSIKPTQKENKPFKLEKKVEETFEIISIDVNNAVSLINNGYPIEFEKINISEEGKIWLKLIGLRFWIKPFNNYYILPNNLKASPEILSAIYLLSEYTPEDVANVIKLENKMQLSFEDGYYLCEEDMKESYTIKLWMYFFKNRIKNGPPFNELEKVREKKVKQLFKDDPYLNNFLQFLSQNRKLS